MKHKEETGHEKWSLSIAAIKMEADNVYTRKSTNMGVVSIYLSNYHLN